MNRIEVNANESGRDVYIYIYKLPISSCQLAGTQQDRAHAVRRETGVAG